MKAGKLLFKKGIKMYFIKEIHDVDVPWLKKISLKYYGGKFCVFLGRKFFLEEMPGYYLENEKGEKLMNKYEGY